MEDDTGEFGGLGGHAGRLGFGAFGGQGDDGRVVGGSSGSTCGRAAEPRLVSGLGQAAEPRWGAWLTATRRGTGMLGVRTRTRARTRDSEGTRTRGKVRLAGADRMPHVELAM